MTESRKERPLTFSIAGWHGIIFSAIFLLYGGVSIILGILDRNYDELTAPIVFVVLGLVLISFALAYREMKSWGWYGLIVVNALVIIGGAARFQQVENIVLIVISAIVLYALLAKSTKQYLFGPH